MKRCYKNECFSCNIVFQFIRDKVQKATISEVQIFSLLYMIPLKRSRCSPTFHFLAAILRGSWATPYCTFSLVAFYNPAIQCSCLSVLICSETFSEDLLPLYKVDGSSLLRNTKKYVSTIDLLKPSRSSLSSPGCRSRSL